MPGDRSPLVLTPETRKLIERWIRAGTTPQRVVTRARIVLLSSPGFSSQSIADRLAISVKTVRLWQRRFSEQGAESLLHDAPGRGRKPKATGRDAVSRVLQAMQWERSDKAAWTIRRLADATGISRVSVHRILRSHQLSIAPSATSDDLSSRCGAPARDESDRSSRRKSKQ